MASNFRVAAEKISLPVRGYRQDNRSTMRCLAALAFLIILNSGLAAQSTDGTVKRIQDRWMQCLKASFQIARKRSPDPNAAAEVAFKSCATEEDELWTYSEASGVPKSSFNHLKSAMKQVLIESK